MYIGFNSKYSIYSKIGNQNVNLKFILYNNETYRDINSDFWCPGWVTMQQNKVSLLWKYEVPTMYILPHAKKMCWMH